jgi:hypothetical protein
MTDERFCGSRRPRTDSRVERARRARPAPGFLIKACKETGALICQWAQAWAPHRWIGIEHRLRALDGRCGSAGYTEAIAAMGFVERGLTRDGGGWGGACQRSRIGSFQTLFRTMVGAR